VDRVALFTVKLLRHGFDTLSGYKVKKWRGTLDEKSVLSRIIFLETVAGVPGFAGGMIRHLQCLRRMEKDPARRPRLYNIFPNLSASGASLFL
jgi:ubiquinol oxidase